MTRIPVAQGQISETLEASGNITKHWEPLESEPIDNKMLLGESEVK